jgi:(S)-mandelate dehydrogenase
MLTVLDLQRRAKARLPGLIFDFIEGGAGDERSVQRNLLAWERIRLIPRVLSLGSARSISTRFLGRTYGAPFGIAPMGLGRLAWPDTDVGLIRAAAAARIPYGLSTAGSTTIERVAELAQGHAWFQIYISTEPRISTNLMERARIAGIETLIVTVDANNPGRRLRDLRNGFALPFRPKPRVVAQFMLHPRWTLQTLRHGSPRMANLETGSSSSTGRMSLAGLLKDMAGASLDWSVLERIRDNWPGKLIVKGVLHAGDAKRMAGIGVDAISVSNHGGRQLGAAVAPIEVLPDIRAAVGPDFPLLLDSGVRSGEDIVKALALGANFVLLGRPFLFAAAALGGSVGGPRVIEVLCSELSGSLAQLGCTSVGELNAGFVYRDNGG